LSGGGYIIVSGRFQPVHLGHLHFWLELRKQFREPLIICVLRQPRLGQLTAMGVQEPYHELSRSAQSLDRNPLPNWERLQLVTYAVTNEPRLAGNTTALLRTRPDLDWEGSLEDLPAMRTWIFHRSSEFERAKAKYYRSMGENVVEIDVGPRDLEGTAIRRALILGETDLSFLPPGCEAFFANQCRHYFEEAKSEQA
jgi:hypothetical protein